MKSEHKRELLKRAQQAAEDFYNAENDNDKASAFSNLSGVLQELICEIPESE